MKVCAMLHDIPEYIIDLADDGHELTAADSLEPLDTVKQLPAASLSTTLSVTANLAPAAQLQQIAFERLRFLFIEASPRHESD